MFEVQAFWSMFEFLGGEPKLAGSKLDQCKFVLFEVRYFWVRSSTTGLDDQVETRKYYYYYLIKTYFQIFDSHLG